MHTYERHKWRRLGLALVFGGLCLSPWVGWAQDAAVTASEPAESSGLPDRLAARLGYGVSLIEGSLADQGPGLTYGGPTPNHVELGVWYFPLRHLGLSLGLEREGFGLYDDGGGKVTAGAMLRGHLAPTARVALGPVRLEGAAGYVFAQLPSFGSSLEPQFSAGQRHGLLLASRALLSLPLGLSAEASGEYTLPLSVKDGTGAVATSAGWSAGGGLSIPLLRAGHLEYAALLHYRYVSDQLDSDAQGLSSQTVHRVGAALQLGWSDVPHVSRPRLGGLAVRVLDADGRPLPGARVTVASADPRPVATGADGQVKLEGLTPGEVGVQVEAEGFLPASVQATVQAWQEVVVEVRSQREPPKTGGLFVTVVDKETAGPVAGVTVSFAGSSYVTDAAGTVPVVQLPPGPVRIQVVAAGYNEGQEVASIAAGRTASVPVQLNRLSKKIPANITGLVRSTRGGGSISAELEIPELGLKITADAKGAFAFEVPGGVYSVRISAPGYLKQQKSVTVKDGDQAIFNVDLHPSR